MAPQLQDCPDEILVEVLRYLPKPDLKSARLTCPRFGRIGAQWLFQRVYFAPRKSVMETFLNVSANPIFARNVTELIYDGRLFLPELTAYEPYRKAVDTLFWDDFSIEGGVIADSEQAGDGDGSESSMGSDATNQRQPAMSGCKDIEQHNEFVADSLVHYARFFDQQQSILEDKKDCEALSIGLQNLPNITTVIALDNFHECSDWLPLRTDDHSSYEWRSGLETYPVSISPSSWSYNEDDERAKWDVRGIQNFIRAVSKHCQNVKELHIGSELSNAPLSMFDMDQDDYDDACILAQRLTCLKLNLYLSRSDSEDEWQGQLVLALKGLLLEAKELRCLSISGPIDANVFKDNAWPHLEILNLGDHRFDAADFEAIIQAHKGTIRELTLRNVNLFGQEGWVDAAKEIGKYLRLRRISILGVSDEVSREGTGNVYLDDETNLAVACSFMQSVPRTVVLHENLHTIIACPEDGEAGDTNSS